MNYYCCCSPNIAAYVTVAHADLQPGKEKGLSSPVKLKAGTKVRLTVVWRRSKQTGSQGIIGYLNQLTPTPGSLLSSGTLATPKKSSTTTEFTIPETGEYVIYLTGRYHAGNENGTATLELSHPSPVAQAELQEGMQNTLSFPSVKLHAGTKMKLYLENTGSNPKGLLAYLVQQVGTEPNLPNDKTLLRITSVIAYPHDPYQLVKFTIPETGNYYIFLTGQPILNSGIAKLDFRKPHI